MRLGVLDVGSNTVHLLVVDAYPGARPLPAFSHKADLSLAAHLEADNTLSRVGEERLTEVVAEALRIAEDKGVEDFLGFATSAVRDAVNGDDVLARIQDQTGASIRVLSGENEARLTFLAARRWFGWSSGRLLVVDIGGGSLDLGPADIPGRAPLVRLVVRTAACGRHRRRLARDRRGARRGAGGSDVAAARRGTPHQGLADHRSAVARRGARDAQVRQG